MLNIQDLRIDFDSTTLVSDINFHVKDGDIACLLGPSGCGKTTILRAIAGFQDIHAGEISLGNSQLSSPGFTLPPENRKIGMVFQDYALFPHLTVEQNIGFGLLKMSAADKRRRVNEMLDLVKLEGVHKRYPHEISGGQAQRVALARSLAPKPQLLLLDEPFSNLDAELRKFLSLEVRDILKELGTSAILVTHDQEEAFAFSDQIGLLYGGNIQQWDTPFNLYHEPANRFVANFIGAGCFLPGTVNSPSTIQTELGELIGNRAYDWPEGTPVDVLLRPDDVILSDSYNDGKISGLQTTIKKKVFAGSASLYTLALPTGSTVEALLTSHHDFSIGDTLHIETDVEHLVAFGPEQLSR